MRPGFPINMSPLGSDPALSKLLTFTVSVNEDRFGLWQFQSQCKEVMWQCCRWTLCTTFSPIRDTALGFCWDSRRAGTGPGQSSSGSSSKGKTRQGDNGNRDTASVAHSLSVFSCSILNPEKPHLWLFVLVDSTFSLHFVRVKTWTAAYDCGHSPRSDHLCHPLDNSVLIPKVLRVAHVVPGFDKLNYSLASSMDSICSKFLLIKLFSCLLRNESVL